MDRHQLFVRLLNLLYRLRLSDLAQAWRLLAVEALERLRVSCRLSCPSLLPILPF